MKNNKILYRPRTADPSTLTTDNLLTLANIITTSRLDHHCPPSLGILTSVQITMLYLQENIRQQALASIFGTSQPTISRAINNVLNVLDVVLPPPPRPKDLKAPTAIRVRWHARAMLVVEECQELVQRKAS
ncbi:transposase family protein [Corynebacterium matruchotii]|uniref:transposase family protein n=1 Tax=Corynebacterium matruchotii TaxID=43768 RepID=UPI0024330917|nr:transposase family protein [Corynebacterium matruchotii]